MPEHCTTHHAAPAHPAAHHTPARYYAAANEPTGFMRAGGAVHAASDGLPAG